MFAAKVKKTQTKLRYGVKGKQIKFFDAQGVDELVSICMTLAQELWVVKERLATVEAAAAKKGVILGDEVEGYAFTPEQRAVMEEEKAKFIDRVFFTLREQSEALEIDAKDEPDPPKLP
ncbi:MAG: hypothetical protein EXR11_02920 [Rhodospirillaceae bacterium]|nr:hypothetical protein [Rhodospirillaceae bacterium]